MARPRHLMARGGAGRLALLVVCVLLVHVLALRWLGSQLAAPSALRKVADPMFTRVLEPQTPPPPPDSVAVAAPPPARPSLRQLTPAAPVEPTPTAVVTPELPAPAPDAAAPEETGAPVQDPGASEPPPPTPPEVAEAPTPQQVASAPAADASTPEPAAPPAPEAAAPTATAQAPASAVDNDPLASDPWPGDSRLSYTLGGLFRGGPLYGSARVQWQRDGTAYQTQVTLDVRLAGTRVMTSQGEVTPQGLVPKVYEETRGSSRRTVRFGDQHLVLADGRVVPRPAGVQDTASQFVELGHRFASGRDVLEVGRSVQVWLARPNGADLWTYDVVAREPVETGAHGPVEAFRLRPRPIANPRGNITAEIWFAPSLQYLPVRIRVSMGEEAFVELQVDTIEQR